MKALLSRKIGGRTAMQWRMTQRPVPLINIMLFGIITAGWTRESRNNKQW